MFRLAYNTNGLAHHRIDDALRMLAELGYEGVAITPDPGQLDPLRLEPAQVRDVRELARELGLGLAIETGSRYLLDARRKHFPTLLEPSQIDRARRLDFYRRCVDLAQAIGADVVSLWSGVAPDGEVADAGAGPVQGSPEVWDRLATGVGRLLEHARGSGIAIAFEPEPGMFVSRPAGFDALAARLGPGGGGGAELGLCLDVGHCVCTGDLPVGRVIREYARRLAQVHLDDGVAGRHDHRMFGEGDVDLPDVVSALLDVGYAGLAAVELSRDSHRGPAAAAEAMQELRAVLVRAGNPTPESP